MRCSLWICALELLRASLPLAGQTAGNVLLVVNQSSAVSVKIGNYYAAKRSIPASNVCRLRVTPEEVVSEAVYESQIERPVAACLAGRGLREKILYIVTTLEVPLTVAGEGRGTTKTTCAVDSELALLYSRMKGAKLSRAGYIDNPFFGKRDEPFRHPAFPIYLVTRLAGYDFADVAGLIDHALVARNRGKFVIDLSSSEDTGGNQWLRTAALLLPENRVVLDETSTVLYGQRDVIGYAAWGSNDKNRKQRRLGFQWLPGAIATEFVSTDARTFKRPPEDWTFSGAGKYKPGQSLTADYIHEGATGCSGHVAEPYLALTPRPEYLLPAYFNGRNLAESYYLSIPALSWQNIVVGDPLCHIGK